MCHQVRHDANYLSYNNNSYIAINTIMNYDLNRQSFNFADIIDYSRLFLQKKNIEFTLFSNVPDLISKVNIPKYNDI